MSAEDIVGVILAAGQSERFGSPKQLLPFGGTTLLGQVVQNANTSNLERVVVVLGRAGDELKERVDFGRAQVVDNTAYRSGCASSLFAGLDAAGDCAGLMLLLGDQPGVGAPIINQVSKGWHLNDRPWAAVTSYRGELGHPFVFARESHTDLRGLHGDKAIWKLIETYPERVLRVPIDAQLPPRHRYSRRLPAGPRCLAGHPVASLHQLICLTSAK